MNYRELIEQQGFAAIVDHGRIGWSITLERDNQYHTITGTTESVAWQYAYEFAEANPPEAFDWGAS